MPWKTITTLAVAAPVFYFAYLWLGCEAVAYVVGWVVNVDGLLECRRGR